MTITLHKGDIPADLDFGSEIAVDTEAMGLQNHRDRLCLVQLSAGDGNAHLVQFEKDRYDAPNLKAVLGNPNTTKLFHYARFDVAILKKYLGVECRPLYCTRTASYLIRTYTERHSLRELCKEVLGFDLSKQQQSTDWGAAELTPDQMEYAANDVYHLHKLREAMDIRLKREGRYELAQKIFDFLPTRADLDLAGWLDVDIFAHL